jgi:hypothetical protein
MSSSRSASESRVLHEEGGFRYTLATEEFGEAIVRVLSESFAREPMGAAPGLSARDLGPLVARFMPEFTTNDLSASEASSTGDEAGPPPRQTKFTACHAPPRAMMPNNAADQSPPAGVV